MVNGASWIHTGSSHIPCDRASDMHPGLTLMTWNSLTVEITDVAPVVRSVAAGADRKENRRFFDPKKWLEDWKLSEDEFHVGIYQSSVPQFVISRFGFHSLYMFFHVQDQPITSGRSRFWAGILMIWGLGRLKSLRVFPCASVDVMFQVIHSSLHGSASISSP